MNFLLGEGVQALVQKGLLNFFVANYFSQRQPRFSICEHRSPLVREILLCKHRQTDHRRVPKNNNILHFLITLEFSLVANCNACFVKKISQLKSDIQPCSLKQASVLIGGSGPRDPPVGSATDIQCQENAFFLMGSKSSFLSESHL